MTVRVRYAPSPTGYLHLGSVRSALFNWLYARQQGGTFILRVEDTDTERSTQPSVRAILESMRWLGLHWDEGPEVGGDHGPYFQTQRLSIYRQYTELLISTGKAYRCYCTGEDLARARAEHRASSGSEQGFRYPGTCRERSDEPDLPHVVRFKAPDSGVTAWNDRVKGRIEIANETLQDAVLMRNNGMPLMNLAVAVDDLTMGVTLVARGDDHMINTPQQIQLYEALGEKVPEFAHLPMILAPSGEKLSKRHAAVAVMDYRDQGYLPDGVLNYLVRLGWSHGDQEIFSRAELIELFDWEHVGAGGSKYDLKKFLHVQASHLRGLSAERFAAGLLPFMLERGLEVDASDSRLPMAIELIRPRSSTFVDAAEALDFFFRDPPELDAKAAAKFLTPAAAEHLTALQAQLERFEPFEAAALEAHVKAWLESSGLRLKDVAQPARVALTGRKQSPGLFEVMEVLGRQRSLARLARAAQHCSSAD